MDGGLVARIDGMEIISSKEQTVRGKEGTIVEF